MSGRNFHIAVLAFGALVATSTVAVDVARAADAAVNTAVSGSGPLENENSRPLLSSPFFSAPPGVLLPFDASMRDFNTLPLPLAGHDGLRLVYGVVSSNRPASVARSPANAASSAAMPIITDPRVDGMGALDGGGSTDGGRQVGGYFGYNQPLDSAMGSTIGFSLQALGNGGKADPGWLLQPGVDYRAPLSAQWIIDSRLFTTYGSEDYLSGRFGGGELWRSSSDTNDVGFRDIGLNLGLGYAFSDQWMISTQTGYVRLVGDAADKAKADDSGTAHQFFGGVIVNYRF